MHRRLTSFLQIRFPERAILLSLLLVAAAIWGFVAVAAEVVEGDTQRFDERLVMAFRVAGHPSVPIGPSWMGEVARDLTALGGVADLSLVTGAVLGFLLITGRSRSAALVFASVAGGLVVSTLLKWAFHRPRPSLVPHLAGTYTSSFPSGHSMLSAAAYLTLGALLARTTANRWLKTYFLAVASALTIVIGISRVFLGVHYPTDVLAGWCAGLAWALLCAAVARRLQQHGEVEPPAPRDPGS
jgi:undecaprenyl-diphosphatase